MELSSPLHTWKPLSKIWPNRVFALVFAFADFTLLYYHLLTLIHSPTRASATLFLADLVLSFMWLTGQAFHMNPISRRVFPKNLSKVVGEESEYPGLDVVICTADPFKEPTIGVVNTALSVMAYDYPTDKLSVYVSDDGGSQITLFGFMEAAKFAKYWLPFCKRNNIMDRSPEVYFGTDPAWSPEIEEIKLMYEDMKARIEKVVERGSVCPEFFTDETALRAFEKWTADFTRNHHPTVIQVLLDNSIDKDVTDLRLPNLIYVSREKSKFVPHHFKAGALNALLRVSDVITNAPIFLVLDCDMYSNDPTTPLRALCYLLDPNADPKLGFVQFPQRFHDVNKNDTYGSEFRPETQINSLGMDGLLGSQFMGTGGFFRRQTLLGSSLTTPHLENKTTQPEDVVALARNVAGCTYEDNTKWGSEIGFRYGTVTEDTYTSYRLHCEGWKSVLCHPERAAFLGDAPMTMIDVLTQLKRWHMGFLDISLSKYCPLTFGIRSMNPLQALCYANYTFRAFCSIPLIIYAFLPPLALLNSFPILPKVSDTRFFLCAFLFLGTNGKDAIDFVSANGTVQKWWNAQRMWLLMGLSSCPFALLEWSLKLLGISTFGFSVTSKLAADDELGKRYQQGLFEFGVESPFFYPISAAAVINLFAFVHGIIQVSKNGRFDDLFAQTLLAGFGVVNGLPVYEAMVLRKDKGKMPLKITLTSVFIVLVLHLVFSWAF